MAEASELDGCYVLKTDLPAEVASKESIHERYKDLVKVASAFRTMKTGHLEMRPIYVRKESRTQVKPEVSNNSGQDHFLSGALKLHTVFPVTNRVTLCLISYAILKLIPR